MVRYASLLSQLIALFNRNQFYHLVLKHNAERYAKGYNSWDHFIAMLFCQLAQAKSLREICGGLACCLGKLRHLGMKGAPSKSTLSYANAHNPGRCFEVFSTRPSRCVRAQPQESTNSDSRTNCSPWIAPPYPSVCRCSLGWAKFRRTKGAIKLHLLLDHDGYLPTYAYISNGKRHDVTIARKVPLAPGSIVAMDRGYNDYKLFAYWTANGIFFVTRLKENADYMIVEQRAIPRNRNIVSDQLIRFTGFYAQKHCPYLLRRVVVWDKDKEQELVFLTNHLDFGATTISAIYKDRWQIELFFKALKQNLKVKTFVGTTENALYIQIWTALIAILLIKYLQFKSKFGWSLSNLVAFLRWNLFTYRDLWEWIDHPFDVLPLVPKSVQIPLPLAGLGQHLQIRAT